MQDSKNDSIHKLEKYLHQFEKKEKKRRIQNRMLKGFILGVIPLLTLIWFGPLQSPSTNENASLVTRTQHGKEIHQPQQKENLARVMEDRPGKDSLLSANEPEGWTKKSNTGDSLIRTSLSDTSKPKQKRETKPELLMKLLVIGEKGVDQKLVFTIRNYDPAHRYSLDFDNGYVQERVGQRSVYAYKRKGAYRVCLRIACKDGREKKIYKQILIAEGDDFFAEKEENSNSSPMAQMTSDLNRRDEGLTVEKASQISSRLPSFPGGEAALQKYLEKRLIYPRQALDNEIEGDVQVKFVVQPDGRLTDPRIMDGLGHGCDEEVLRVILDMPRWIPGIKRGEKAAQYYSMPVRFRLGQK